MARRKRDLMLDDLNKAKEEIEKITDEELEKEHSKNEKFKKLFIRILAIFLVMLMLTFLYLGSPVYDYIFGLATSSKINEGEIIFKNEVKIIINNQTMQFLQEIYNPLGNEVAVCLIGNIQNEEYIITDYYEPTIYDNGWNFVSHSTCSNDAIIMLHSHPFKRCAPSQRDKNTLSSIQQSKPDVIMMIMCGRERFSAVIN